MTKTIRVTAKRDGFRRAGRAWSGTTEVPAGDLSKAQLAQLKSEPMLVVDEIDAPAPKEPGGGEGGTKPPRASTSTGKE